MKNSDNPWSFFDKIYCISIDTRIDRRTEAQKQFAHCGLEDLVEFVLVKKHPRDREKGIFQSHIMCLAKGLEAGAEHILIFEDDIVFRKFEPQTLLKSCEFLSKNPHWQSFFLGAISGKIQETKSSAVKAIQFRCLAHAYALNRPFAKHIVQLPWSTVPFDTLLRQESKVSFAISPMIAFQSPASTDNQTLTLDRIRRLLGGLTFIQSANEFYQTHKSAIIFFHVLIVTVFSLFVIKL